MNEDLIRRLEARAQEIPQEVADRDNECSACCGAYGTDTWDDHADDIDRLLMLEAVTELLKYRSALEEIAQQKLTEEMAEDLTIAASFEDGYNKCVRVAREALENK